MRQVPASIEETTKEDLPATVSLEARDFDLTSMSMQLADGDGVKKRNSSTIDLPVARRKVI